MKCDGCGQEFNLEIYAGGGIIQDLIKVDGKQLCAVCYSTHLGSKRLWEKAHSERTPELTPEDAEQLVEDFQRSVRSLEITYFRERQIAYTMFVWDRAVEEE